MLEFCTNILKVLNEEYLACTENPKRENVGCVKSCHPARLSRLPEIMLNHGDLSSRQRWMLYPVYGASAIFLLLTIILFATLNEMREFLGDKGIELCWMYGSFDRYISIHLGSICVNAGVLLILYSLACQDWLKSYLVIWALWLFEDSLLSLFDMSFC
jgi:hypothetical protein